jgi:hypothetical protein
VKRVAYAQKERDACRALSARSVAKHAEWRD